MIPNLFRRLFGEGALAAAFLPSYTKLQLQNPQLAKAFCGVIQACLLLVVIRKHIKMPINNLVLKLWATTALLTLAMSVVVALVVHYFLDPASSLWGSAAILSLAVGM